MPERAAQVMPGDLYQSAEDCPEIERHTSCPSGYLAWWAWADEMAKTHRSTRCPTCGFCGVWVPKKATGCRA